MIYCLSTVDLQCINSMEEDNRGDITYCWVTPLQKKDVFEILPQRKEYSVIELLLYTTGESFLPLIRVV